MTKMIARRDALLIFCVLLVAYCYVLPRWADWSQNSRLNLVRALVEQGTTRIDAYVANTGDYAEFAGHTYTDKAPGPAFVGLPLYAAVLPLIEHPAINAHLARLAGGGALSGTLNPEGTGIQHDKVRHFVAQYLLTSVTVALPSAGLGVLVYLVLAQLGFSRGIRLLITLGYGLATPAVAYASNFYSHQFAAALLFGAFALLVLPSSTHRPEGVTWHLWKILPRAGGIGAARALLFGLLCGFVLISEYPAALIVAALGLYALPRLTLYQLGLTIAGGLLPLILMAVYDLRSFGTIMPVGYSHSALWQDQHHTGFLSITYPRPEALWGLTFSPYRGLFVRAPWLLFALPGFVIWWRSRTYPGAWATALAAVVALTLFYASSIMWWGGFTVGPRYLVPMLPFLAIAAAYGIRPLWRSLAGRATAGVLVLAAGVLTWAELLARQSFPPDTYLRPWSEYTLPAWAEGDIARNIGMALGLQGATSLLPLAALLLLLIGILVLPFGPHRSPRAGEHEQPARSLAESRL